MQRRALARDGHDLGDRILFIDGEAIVIDKPAGLPVDRAARGGAERRARIWTN